MIRALLLIFDPAATWERIALAQRSVYFVVFVHLLPLMAITLGVETWGLVRLGEARRTLSDLPATVYPVSLTAALRYTETAFCLYLVTILAGARVVQKVSNSFQAGHTYRQAITAVAYGLGPYFLCRMLDALPPLNTWLCFATGIALCLPSFYHGVPLVMRPDPARAFGLFLMIFIIIAIFMGLAHFVGVAVLHEQFLPALHKFLYKFAPH